MHRKHQLPPQSNQRFLLVSFTFSPRAPPNHYHAWKLGAKAHLTDVAKQANGRLKTSGNGIHQRPCLPSQLPEEQAFF